MLELKSFFKLTVLTVAVLAAGCSKEQSVPPPKHVGAHSSTTETMPAPAPVSPSVATPTTRPATPEQPAPAPTPVSTDEQIQQLAQLELAYTTNSDFAARIETIYKITDIGTPETIALLGRLFHREKETDLKTEIVDSLFDIDGLDDKKAALLAAAAGPDQPKDVRESAIDGLTDLAPKFALPILQALLSDKDEDIRELAKDAIDQLQAADSLQK